MIGYILQAAKHARGQNVLEHKKTLRMRTDNALTINFVVPLQGDFGCQNAREFLKHKLSQPWWMSLLVESETLLSSHNEGSL